MNWIKQYNQMEKIKENIALDLLCEHEKLKENTLDSIYREIYQLEYDIDNLDIFSFRATELSDKVIEMLSKFIDIRKDLDGKIKVLNEDFKKVAMKIRDLQIELIKECGKYMKSTKEVDLLMIRTAIFKQKLIKMTDSLGILKIGEFEIFEDIRDELDTISRIAIKRVNKENGDIKEIKPIIKTKFQYDKIFDYKKLCYLAQKEGYIYNRCNGDHLIYKHNKTGKIVPIPVNSELHFGIMRNIQKMIQINSVA